MTDLQLTQTGFEVWLADTSDVDLSQEGLEVWFSALTSNIQVELTQQGVEVWESDRPIYFQLTQQGFEVWLTTTIIPTSVDPTQMGLEAWESVNPYVYLTQTGFEVWGSVDFLPPVVGATLLYNAKQQFIDENGDPLVDGYVTFSKSDLSRLKQTYQISDKKILNTNPIRPDSRGQAIIMGNGQYNQVLQDENAVQIWDDLTDSYIPMSTGRVNGDLMTFNATEIDWQRLTMPATESFLRSDGSGQQPLFLQTTSSSGLFYKASTQSIPDLTVTGVEWDSQDYDDIGFWDNGAPTRLVVPTGVSRVRIGFNVTFNNDAGLAAVWRAALRKNGVEEIGQPAAQVNIPSGPTGHITLGSTSGALRVNAGDYFEVVVEQGTGGVINVVGVNSATPIYSSWVSIWTA